jgi:hypothetical protein
MPLVLGLVPVLGMDVSFHILLLTSKKGKGMYLIHLLGHFLDNLPMQAHEHRLCYLSGTLLQHHWSS